MANYRRTQNSGRRMDYGRNDRNKVMGRSGVSPWQSGSPGAGLPNLLPFSGNSTETTLALANNLISNLLQSRQNPVPSLLDMPIRREFVPDMGRFDRPFGPNRMGNQGNFRRTGNYNRSGERINSNRRPFRPNEGQRNRPTPKKEVDSKPKPVIKTESAEGAADGETQQVEAKEEDKKEGPKTRYDDISPQLLKCHICNKSMWDGRSFENHLSGRAHSIMMQKTAESYALAADTMRQEFKIREMKRNRKAGIQPPRDFYCAMCDMYAGDGAIHRTTVGHRKLKKYLHPNCTSCHKEMPTRIELDEHRLAPEHLRCVQDKQDVVSKPKPEVMVISTLSVEQSFVRDDRQRKRPNENLDQSTNNEGAAKDENAEEENKPAENEEIDEENTASVAEDGTILDFKEGDDVSLITSTAIPNYNTRRPVGRSFLSPFSCVECLLCHKLLDSEHTASVHLRTWRHHQLFVRMLRQKGGIENDGNKRAAEMETQDADSKRRKTVEEAKKEMNGEEDVEMKEDEDWAGENDEENDTNEVEAGGKEENWEQMINEIIEDEDIDLNPQEEEQVPEPVVEEPKPVVESGPVTRSTPRGRGRRRN